MIYPLDRDRHRWTWRFAITAVLIPVFALGLSACGSSKSKSSSKSLSAADQLVNAGLAAQNKGQLAAAVGAYKAAIKDNPLEVYAYYDLGVVYQQEKDIPDSANYYQKALLINPTYKAAMFNLAILETPGSPATAVSDYKQLLTFDANDSNVLLNLGLLERKVGDAAAATNDLSAAVRITPSLASRIPGGVSGTSPTSVPARTTIAPASTTSTTR